MAGQQRAGMSMGMGKGERNRRKGSRRECVMGWMDRRRTWTGSIGLPEIDLTSMRPFVDLEVLRPGKHLSASGEGAGKGLLSGVDPDMVHQLVLGLEWPALPSAPIPKTGVVGYLGASHVLHRNMRHYLVHGGKYLSAGFLW